MRTRQPQLLRLLIALLLLVAVTGCQSGETLAEVTGVVLFHGEPASAEITAQPIDGQGNPAGRPSTAYADDTGRFRLTYASNVPGAILGTHQVTVNVISIPREAIDSPGGRRPKTIKQARLPRQVNPSTNHWEFWLTY